MPAPAEALLLLHGQLPEAFYLSSLGPLRAGYARSIDVVCLPAWSSTNEPILEMLVRSGDVRSFEGCSGDLPNETKIIESLRSAQRVGWSGTVDELTHYMRQHNATVKAEGRSVKSVHFKLLWSWTDHCTSAKAAQLTDALAEAHVLVSRQCMLHESTTGISSVGFFVQSTTHPRPVLMSKSVLENANSTARIERRNEMRGRWMLDNVCIGYHKTGKPFLMQGHNAVPPDPAVLWELQFPEHWTEFPVRDRGGAEKQGLLTGFQTVFQRTNFRAARARPPSFTAKWLNDNAFAAFVPVSQESLYHMLFHAVPTFEFIVRDSGVAPNASHVPFLYPHYSQFWPGQAPVVQGMRPLNRSIDQVRKWRAWLMFMGSSLVPADKLEVLAFHTEHVMRNGKFNCHARLHGGHAIFYPRREDPIVKNTQSKVPAAARLSAFRRAVHANLGFTSYRTPSPSIVFALRRGVRAIHNEMDLREHLGLHASPRLRHAIRFAVFEQMPLVAQWELVTSSRAVAGVHGQAHVWVTMLFTDLAPAAALEILPENMESTFSLFDYPQLTEANNVKHFWLPQNVSSECLGEYWRTCGNVTVNVREVENILERMMDHIQVDLDSIP